MSGFLVGRIASLAPIGQRVMPGSCLVVGVDGVPVFDAGGLTSVIPASNMKLVTAAVALRGYLTAPEDPGGPSRRVEMGADADLCLLSVPLSEALAHPESSLVRLVLADGRPVATS